MEVTDYDHGVPSRVDPGTTAPDGARSFSSALFGWAAPPGPPVAGGRTLAAPGERMVGGIGSLMEPSAPSGWTGFGG